MRRRLLEFVTALFTCCALSCGTASVELASGHDPSAAVESFIGAFNNLDLQRLRMLFAKDATAFLPFANTGPRIAGREAILEALSPLFSAERARSSKAAPFLNLQAKDIAIQRIGEAAAVVTFDVGNERVNSRRTLVLEFRSGQWVVRHLHASNVRLEQHSGG